MRALQFLLGLVLVKDLELLQLHGKLTFLMVIRTIKFIWSNQKVSCHLERNIKSTNLNRAYMVSSRHIENGIKKFNEFMYLLSLLDPLHIL